MNNDILYQCDNCSSEVDPLSDHCGHCGSHLENLMDKFFAKSVKMGKRVQKCVDKVREDPEFRPPVGMTKRKAAEKFCLDIEERSRLGTKNIEFGLTK